MMKSIHLTSETVTTKRNKLRLERKQTFDSDERKSFKPKRHHFQKYTVNAFADRKQFFEKHERNRPYFNFKQSNFVAKGKQK